MLVSLNGPSCKKIFVYIIKVNYYNTNNRICGVMVIMIASSAVDLRFEPRSGQTKDY
jgi:hypothetical protein